MPNPRIKGQEVEVHLVVNGKLIRTISAVKSLEITNKLEIKEEGFLGETTNRYDEVFNGVSGKIEFQMDDPDVFDVVGSIVERARRRDAGVQINIKAALNFPSGRRRLAIIPNVFFGPIPINFGGRGDFGTMSLDFAAEDVKYI